MSYYFTKAPGGRGQINGKVEWVGGTDGDFNKAANWSPAVVPDTGDTLYFNSGSVDLDTNLSQTTKTFDGIYIGEGYTGNIGSETNLLRANTVVLSIRKRGGAVWWSGPATEVYISGTATSEPGVYLTGNPIGLVFIAGTTGQVKLQSTTVTTLHCSPPAGDMARVYLDSAVTLTTLKAFNSSFIDGVSGATAIRAIGPSELIFTSIAGHGSVLAANGAAVRHRATGNITGTITLSGTSLFELDQSADDDITIDRIKAYTGGIADLRSGVRNVTVTNNVDFYGGQLLLDDGMTAAVS